MFFFLNLSTIARVVLEDEAHPKSSLNKLSGRKGANPWTMELWNCEGSFKWTGLKNLSDLRCKKEKTVREVSLAEGRSLRRFSYVAEDVKFGVLLLAARFLPSSWEENRYCLWESAVPAYFFLIIACISISRAFKHPFDFIPCKILCYFELEESKGPSKIWLILQNI